MTLQAVSYKCYASSMETARQTLRTRKTTMRCQELVELLTRLGFIVRDGRRGGHKIFTHSGLPEFTSASFNCGSPERSEEHTSELQSRGHLVCRLLLEKKKTKV